MRRAFPLVFAACLLASVAPIWSTRHLSSVDLPQHLFLVRVLASLGDPASRYHETCVAAPKPTSVTFHYGVNWLASAVGLEAAMKLWLSLAVAGVPLAMLVLLRSLGRSR
jgi:hypothetical protein